MALIDFGNLFNGIRYHSTIEKARAVKISCDCIVIDTDGSCISEEKNAKHSSNITSKAGWGFVAHSQFDSSLLSNLSGSIIDGADKWGPVITSPDYIDYLGANTHTNNTAELSALGHAFLWTLDYISKGSKNQLFSFYFRSDSVYAVKSILGRFCKHNEDNIKLIRKCSTLLATITSIDNVNVEFIYAKGHSGDAWNDLVDELSKKGRNVKKVEIIPLEIDDGHDVLISDVSSSNDSNVPSLLAPLPNLGFQSIIEDNSVLDVPLSNNSFIDCFLEGLDSTNKLNFKDSSSLRNSVCDFSSLDPLYKDKNEVMLIDYLKLIPSLPVSSSMVSYHNIESFNGEVALHFIDNHPSNDFFIQLCSSKFEVNTFIWKYLENKFSIALCQKFIGNSQTSCHQVHLIKSDGFFKLLKSFKYISSSKSVVNVLPSQKVYDKRFDNRQFNDFSNSILTPAKRLYRTRKNTALIPPGCARNSIGAPFEKPFLRGNSLSPPANLKRKKKLLNNKVIHDEFDSNLTPPHIDASLSIGSPVITTGGRVSKQPIALSSFITMSPKSTSHCSSCGLVGHNKLNCLQYLVDYNSVCCSWLPTEDFCRIPMVKYVPYSCAGLIQSILKLVVDTIIVIVSNSLQNKYQVLLSHLVLCIKFIPHLIVLPNGKAKSIPKLKVLLDKILQSECFIFEILKEREEFLKGMEPKVFKKMVKNSTNKLNRTQELKVEDFIINGRPGKALDFISGLFKNNFAPIIDDVGNFTPEISNAFHVLHPRKSSEPLIDDFLSQDAHSNYFTSQSVSIEVAEFKEVVNHLPMNSANGLSGWSNDLLKFLLNLNLDNNKEFSDLFLSFCKLINLFLDGKIGIADSWINSLLLFIKKPDKINEVTGKFECSGGVRPIAIDEPIIRLVGRCAAFLKSKVVGNLLSPLQMGVGIPRGVEYVAHAASLWIKESLVDNSCKKVTIKVDVKNAFNSLPRWLIRLGVLKYSPDLVNYFDWSYGSSTKLVMINGVVIGHSETGLRQGDPLGPMFYSMGIQLILLKFKSHYPNIDILYYLDDGYLHGLLEETLEAFDFLKNEMQKVNQIFDISKCTIFGNRDTLSLINLPCMRQSSDGLIILGCPFGTSSFIQQSLCKSIDSLLVQCGYLKTINNSISAYNILKFCINTKGTYLARVCTPWDLKNHALKFDATIDDIIASWVNLPSLSPLSSNLRSLPFGLNLPKLSCISMGAWSNSFASALEKSRQLKSDHFHWSIENENTYLSNYSLVCRSFMPDFNFKSIEFIPSQKENTSLHYTFLTTEIRNVLLRETEPLSYFICMSRFQDESPLWLNWLHFKNLCKGLTFSNSDFQFAIKLRLFIHQQLPHDVMCMCSTKNNGNVVPVSSDNNRNLNKFNMMFHSLTCETVAAEIKKRHDNISVAIHHFLTRYSEKGKIVTQTEEQYLCSSNGERKKVDVTVVVDNTTYYIDVSIFNCGCPTHARVNKDSSLERMVHQESHKRDQYKKVNLSNNPNLIPFILDTSGNFGPMALKFIKKIAEYRIGFLSENKFIKALKSCILICLFRGFNCTNSIFYEILNEKISTLDVIELEVDQILHM